MEFFKRTEAIERLLSSLDIPRSLFVYDHAQGIGPYDPEFFDKYCIRRQDREELAKQALDAMTDEDLYALCESSGRLESFAFEYSLFDPPPWYAGGFGVSVYKPDYEHWAKMDYWTLDEAACLSLGFKPEKMPPKNSVSQSPYDALNYFRNRISLIQRAPITSKLNHDEVSPNAFVEWAEGKSLEMPVELVTAVNATKTPRRPKMLNSVDSRQHDSALKVILGLLAYYDGYAGGAITSQMKKDVSSGLADLGLNLDPKTLVKVLGEAVNSRKRFVEDQQKRDSKDI